MPHRTLNPVQFYSMYTVINESFVYLIWTGDMGVGKSCLLHQFTEKKCKYSTLHLLVINVKLPLTLNSSWPVGALYIAIINPSLLIFSYPTPHKKIKINKTNSHHLISGSKNHLCGLSLVNFSPLVVAVIDLLRYVFQIMWHSGGGGVGMCVC